MTKKQKLRRNSFAADFNAGEDDFILAELDVMLDEEEPSPVPLNHFLDDEEIIERLLIHSGFSANDQPEEDERNSSTPVIDDIDLADDSAAYDQFVVESIEPAEQNRHTETEQIPVSKINSMAGFDEQNAMTTETAGFNPEKSELELEYENKVKKATLISYASLGVGFVALLSTVVMVLMLASMQTKISRLSDLVSILEEDMGSIAGKNPDLEINNTDSSIERLNQKLNAHPENLEEQKEASSDTPENKMTADETIEATNNKSLDNQPAKPPAQENKNPSETIVKKTIVGTKQATLNKSNEKQLAGMPVPGNKKPSEATVKKLPAEKKAANNQSAAGWSVNLTAFEDQDYAKRKAAKYLQKGISVKVIAVNINNKTWYQLKVGGFKNKEDATANAAKIKKSLNLNSVSVVNK